MRHIGYLVIFVFALSLAGCSSGNSSTSSSSSTSSTVTVSPASASVATNATLQLTASISGSTAGAAWSVNGSAGGNLTVGTVDSTGLYTAPAVVPNPATVTVTATSLADATQTASAKITVTSGTALSLSISPSSASVYTGRTQQFTAVFNTAANNAVTWEVNSVIGGNSTTGTISSSGLYMAPVTVPATPTVTITAVSQADTTKSATASVTILPGTTIAVTPSYATVPTGGQQTFTATANGSPISVTWALNCSSTQPGGCGSITAAGVYTAPTTPPSSGVNITATSTDTSTVPAGAVVTVEISNGSLIGQYAFSMAGKNGATPYVAAGSLTFDGAGNITGGVEDVNISSASTVTISGGSYHVGSDGRGSATLQTSNGTQSWLFALRDQARAFLMRADGGGVTGVGTLDLQDTSAFTTALQGAYTLQLTDATAGQSSATAMAGAITADGAGNVTQGTLDVASTTAASTPLALTGTYATADSSGRGTLALTSTAGNQTFTYYIVDANHVQAVETDSANLLCGSLVRQAASTTLTSLAGTFGFVTSGQTTQGPIGLGGIVTINASGTVTAGSGDSNLDGNWQSAVTISGSVQVTDAVNGRALASLSFDNQPRTFALYLQQGGSMVMLETDGTGTASGRALPQSAALSLSTSFLNNYAAELVGTDFINSPGELDAVGMITPNGGSAFTGTLDINAAGTIAHSAALTGSYLPSVTLGRLTGSWQTNSSSLPSAQLVFYVLDANHVLVLETDGNRVLVGQAEKPQS